jgi:hypothetical protein
MAATPKGSAGDGHHMGDALSDAMQFSQRFGRAVRHTDGAWFVGEALVAEGAALACQQRAS